jgi:hypothetical protein
MGEGGGFGASPPSEWTCDGSRRGSLTSLEPTSVLGLGGPRASGREILIVDWSEKSSDCDRLTTLTHPDFAMGTIGGFTVGFAWERASIGTGLSAGGSERLCGGFVGPNSDVSASSAAVGNRSARNERASSAPASAEVEAAPGNNEEAPAGPKRVPGDSPLKSASLKSTIAHSLAQPFSMQPLERGLLAT